MTSGGVPYQTILLLFILYKIASAGQTGLFWHITDIHYDVNYTRNGDSSNLCHNSSDVDEATDNGEFGNFYCDSPYRLVGLTLRNMKKIQPNPDFVIWTGDNLPHTRHPGPDWNTVFETLKNVTSLLRNKFPNIPILPCIGNHDTSPPNDLYAKYNEDGIYKDYLEKGGWNTIIPEDSWGTFKSGGYFSYNVKSGFKIISLNTILWYTSNPLVINDTDPSGQMNWLEQQLNSSSFSGEKVYIIGHVSPGFYNKANPGEFAGPLYYPQYSKRFLDITHRYSTIILTQLYGHIHLDMFQLYHYNTGNALGFGLLSPSVTPWYSNLHKNENVSVPVNPTVRLLHYNIRDFVLLNYDQYYLNLTRANSLNEEPSYELLYTFTEAYGVKDLSVSSFVHVYEKMKSTNDTFEKFYNFLTGGKEFLTCDTHCKTAQLCSMSAISIEEYEYCMKQDTKTRGNGKLQVETIVVAAVSLGCIILVCVGLFSYLTQKEKKKQNYLHLREV